MVARIIRKLNLLASSNRGLNRLAIQQAIRHFSKEIQGSYIVVFTDHKAIVGSFKSPNAQPHNAIASNKIMEIAQYTSDVRFLEGKANAVADWLSRLP